MSAANTPATRAARTSIRVRKRPTASLSPGSPLLSSTTITIPSSAATTTTPCRGQITRELSSVSATSSPYISPNAFPPLRGQLSSPEITSLSQYHSSQPFSRPRLDRTIIHVLTPTPNTARRFSAVPSMQKSTNCKKSGWRLPKISKHVVILGDSNVSKITESRERDIQVESYPGAKIRNLEQMMIHPAETDGTHPEIVILSVGINDVANKPGVTTIRNLRRVAVRAGKCFPHSVFAIPEINCSDRLPMVEQDHIMSTSKSLLDIRSISATLDKLRRTGYISKKQLENLEPPNTPRPRLLYLLPKIHKAKAKWPQHQMPPGRPIISVCNSESYKIAEYIDHCLVPFAVTHDSYIKNTTDFIDKVIGIEIPRDALLFSMDVESFYTNIDNNSGIKAIKQTFLRKPDFDRPDVDILVLLKISLEHNDFLFDSNWNLQIFGIAMGKRFAPNYANLFMAEWGKQALRKCKILPLFYLRYLDDIFGIWTLGDDEYRVFLDTLNIHQNCVKLTSVTSKQSTDFLDTTIFKGNALIRMDTLTARFILNQQIQINYCTKTSSIPNIPSLVYSSCNYYDFTGYATINQTLWKPFKYFSIV